MKVNKNNEGMEVVYNSDQDQLIIEEGDNQIVFTAFDEVLSYLKR